MAISPLLSIAGKTVVPFARDIVEQVTGGLTSFQKLLRPDKPSDVDATSSSDDDPTPHFPASASAAQLEAIRNQPLKELEAFVDRLRDRLLTAGIDLSKEIPLKVGLGGDIHVDGAHSDRAAIEDLLTADSQLAATFRMLSNALAKQHKATSGDSFSSELRLTIDASEFKVTIL